MTDKPVKRTTLSIPGDLDEQIEAMAQAEERPWSRQIVLLLREAVAARKGVKGIQ